MVEQLKSGTQGSVVIRINIFNCTKIGIDWEVLFIQ